MSAVVIAKAEGCEDMDHVRALFREDQDWLGDRRRFQDFEEELRGIARRIRAATRRIAADPGRGPNRRRQGLSGDHHLSTGIDSP